MSLALLDELHDSTIHEERTTPSTIEEFITFGLQPEDFVYYCALIQRMQSDLMLQGYHTRYHAQFKRDDIYSNWPAYYELIEFCANKNIIDQSDGTIYRYLSNTIRIDVDSHYYYGWLRYPMDFNEFRLSLERQLSRWWDKSSTYILDTFGNISFSCDENSDISEYYQDGIFNPPRRVRRYDSNTKKSIQLKNSEVRKLFDIAQKEKDRIAKEIAIHEAKMPTDHNVSAIINGFPWIEKLYSLYYQQEIIENVYGLISEAVNTPDIYQFKNSDSLFVFCSSNTCEESNHLLSKMQVEFTFYGKPNKQYFIQRCAHCMRFQISLTDLIDMFDSYGVPCCKIVYSDDGQGDFSDFSPTSIFHDMGYTVNQSAGLSAVRRQSILRNAIETGKATKQQVLTFLMQRMNINGAKIGNETAFNKWKEDYDYIRNL